MKKKLQLLINSIKCFLTSKKFNFFVFIMGIFILSLVLIFTIYSLSYSQKSYSNIYIGEVNFGSLGKSEIMDKLNTNIVKIEANDLSVTYNDKEWKTPFKDLQINYDLTTSVENIYSIGRRGSFIQKAKERIQVLFVRKELYAVFSYNKSKKDEFFNKIYQDVNIPEKDANIVFEDGLFVIKNEQSGLSVNDEILNNNFIAEIGFLEDRNISLEVKNEVPKLSSNQLNDLLNQANRIIKEPIKLVSEKNNYEVEKEKIAGWLDLVAVKNKSETSRIFKRVFASDSNYSPQIIINREKVKSYIGEIATSTNQDPIDAKLTIKDGKAIVFESSQDGYKLNQEKTLDSIMNLLSDRIKVAGISTDGNEGSKQVEINMILDVLKPAVSNDTINNLGIRELIGKGTTNFKGSPSNRKTNIKVGSAIFNGIMIKPGEVFSTTKTLGEISTEKGFLPELVIKEDTTKPEVGGGLCQVSTTIFRAALNAGLPIVERSNHKYRVSYYEPPVGMDATIYDPSPDFKFENNTNGYILIQTYINGTELTFEFYGTSDGRKVEISDPVLYDITSPGEPVYKEDPSLAPGEVKQKEKAHDGSKASFHYKVTKNDSVLFEKTFYSSYVPWRAVYLVGPGTPVGEQSAPVPENPPPPSPDPTPTPTP